jgi:F420-dependent oxidoreductase-like protein
MRFALMVEPQQGLSYEQQLALARMAETLGFEAFFRSDHFTSFPGPAGRPSTDAWTVLAGLARETRRIRLGALVSPVTFRHPGPFVKVVTTVDEMSSGRVEVGVGAGWNDVEHRELGLAFPEIKERADMLEDQLEILHGLWEQPDGWSFQGRHVSVEGARFVPKPVQKPHPPIIVGSEGSPRSLRIAARFADEFNLSSADPDKVPEILRRLDEECRTIGRDPRTLRRSLMAGLLIGADEAELQRRTRAQMEHVGESGRDPVAWLALRRPRWVCGTPEQAREQVARYAEAGVERMMLQDFMPWDHAMIELAAAELIGRV